MIRDFEGHSNIPNDIIGMDYCQQHGIADQLLQQCLVPVVPNPRELTGGVWFRCRICGKVELTSKLSLHARQVHHTDHVTDCISRYVYTIGYRLMLKILGAGHAQFKIF